MKLITSKRFCFEKRWSSLNSFEPAYLSFWNVFPFNVLKYINSSQSCGFFCSLWPVATNLTPIRGSLIHGFFLCMVITYQKMVCSFWKRNMIVPSTSENWESVVSSYKNGHRPEKNVQLRLGRFNKKIVNSNNDKNNNIKIPESTDVTVLKKKLPSLSTLYEKICIYLREKANNCVKIHSRHKKILCA